MQNAIPNFLRPPLVPELTTNVAAGSPRHVHFGLIHVTALRAAPHEFSIFLHDFNLAVPAAALAVVALGVQLGIDDIIVDELDYPQHRFQVVLHVGNLDVADGSTGRQGLELGFKPEFLKGVNRLRHMDVVAVGNIILVGHAGDDAEAALKGLGELVGGGFQRSTIKAKVNVVLSLPGLAGVVEPLHDRDGKGLGLRIGVTLSGHVLHTLIKAGKAESS